ncbi:hypothetical protein BHE74_00049449 [Ensete ventricosum]|nr:hypothetical protein BHE74_00049449 [Ensete ventricosum]
MDAVLDRFLAVLPPPIAVVEDVVGTPRLESKPRPDNLLVPPGAAPPLLLALARRRRWLQQLLLLRSPITGLAVGTETSLKARDEGRKESRLAVLLPRIPWEQLRRCRDCRRWIIYSRREERGGVGKRLGSVNHKILVDKQEIYRRKIQRRTTNDTPPNLMSVQLPLLLPI